MQLKVAIIKDLYISLQRIEGKACFARHIAHILPIYHTERIKSANTNHREVAPWRRLHDDWRLW